MPKVTVYNQEGTPVGEHELSPDVFQVPANPALLHQVVVALEAASRHPIAHTKRRGEVRGGGKKPWKQKHTGRARHGSIRSPLWRHGGVTFGPRSDRNFTKRLNTKMKHAAMRMVLSEKVQGEHFLLLDALTLKEAKTKLMANVLQKLPLNDRKKKALLAIPGDGVVRRASRNLPTLHMTDVRSLNLLDLLSHPFLITTVDAVKTMTQLWGKHEKNI